MKNPKHVLRLISYLGWYWMYPKALLQRILKITHFEKWFIIDSVRLGTKSMHFENIFWKWIVWNGRLQRTLKKEKCFSKFWFLKQVCCNIKLTFLFTLEILKHLVYSFYIYSWWVSDFLLLNKNHLMTPVDALTCSVRGLVYRVLVMWNVLSVFNASAFYRAYQRNCTMLAHLCLSKCIVR